MHDAGRLFTASGSLMARLVFTVAWLLLATLLLTTGRPASLRDIEVDDWLQIRSVDGLPEGAPIRPGDRLVAVDGVAVGSTSELDAVVGRARGSVGARVATRQDTEEVLLDERHVDGPLPESLSAGATILQINGVAPDRELSADELRQVLEGSAPEPVAVTYRPADALLDGALMVVRPPLPWSTYGLTLVGLLLLLAGVGRRSWAPLLGVAWALLGLAAVAADPVAGLPAWTASAGWGAVVAGTLGALAPASQTFGARWTSRSSRPGRRRQRRRKLTEGGSGDVVAAWLELFSAALPDARPAIVLGGAGGAVLFELGERGVDEHDADDRVATLLGMLALEGGALPRPGLADWVDDPFAGLPESTGVEVAVRLTLPVESRDVWCFVVVRQRAPGEADPHSQRDAVVETIEAAGDGEPEQASALLLRGATALLRQARRARAARVAPARSRGGDTVERSEEPLPVRSVGASAGRADADRAVAPGGPHPPDADPAPVQASPVGGDAAGGGRPDVWSQFLERRSADAYPVDDPNALRPAEWKAIDPLARSERPCLIVGEAGSGKEFVARAVHARSVRRDGRVAVLDCARLPGTVVELELFGAGDGTGLVDTLGRGTLVLKSASALGRVALEQHVARLRAAGVRLVFVERVSASGSGIPEVVPPAIREAVGPRWLAMKPLREREGDVARFATYFLLLDAMAYERPARSLDPLAEGVLEALELPGNFHDLRALMRAAVLRADGPVVQVRDLVGEDGHESAQQLAQAEQERERVELIDALQRTEGNKSEAARVLGLTRGSLLRRLRRHGLA